jgi:hypothetical protein
LKELEHFYKEHCSQLEIYNEYNDPITWDTLKKSALEMSMISPIPKKWVYGFEKGVSYSKCKTLHTVDCTPSEAELWFPFDHVLYQKTEKEAIKQYSVYTSYNIRAEYYSMFLIG